MSREFCDHLIDLLASWGRVEAKPMFGGYGIYRQGQIFAIVVDDTLFLKTDDSNRANYMAAGCEPFAYEAKGKVVVMSYWQAPPHVLDDADTLCMWAQKSYQAGLRAARKKQKPRR